MNKLILHEVHRGAGAVFGEHEGWMVPLHYGDWEREYHAVHGGVGISDLFFRGRLRVTGTDRAAFLHNMLTNDINTLTPGTACYAALLTDRAKLISDMYIFAQEDSFLLDVEPGSLETVGQFLEKHIIADDVTIRDDTSTTGRLFLLGSVPKPLMNKYAGGVSRANGYHFVCPAESLEEIWSDLTRGGAVPVGLVAQETLRIEAGIPRFGTDMNDSDLILEAGLTDAISFTKGCYLGQEVVARVTTQGRVNRKLVRLIIQGSDPVKKGEKIFKDSEDAGHITSSAFSPGLGKIVALGTIKAGFAGPGTTVRVAGREAVVSPREDT